MEDLNNKNIDIKKMNKECFRKTSKEEAEVVLSNCNIKMILKTDDFEEKPED